MRLIILRLKVDFKIAEELMEIMSQSDCIAWAIDIRKCSVSDTLEE
jgi:hypothetical protein